MDRTVIFTTAEEPESVNRMREFNILRDLELRQRVCRPEVCDAVTAPGTGCREEMWGVLRPGLFEFLDVVDRTADYVVVWSAGKPRYVFEFCRRIFAGRRQPDLVLTSNFGLQDGVPLGAKPLSMLLNHPRLPGCSLARTVIVDDRLDNLAQNMQNGILIAPYEPELTVESIKRPDPALRELADWWEQNHTAADYRLLDKSRIFSRIDGEAVPPR